MRHPNAVAKHVTNKASLHLHICTGKIRAASAAASKRQISLDRTRTRVDLMANPKCRNTPCQITSDPCSMGHTQSSPTGTHPAFRLSIEYRVRTSFPYALLHASPCSLEVCQGRRTIHLITFAPVHVCAGYEAPSQKATWCSTHIVFIPYSRSRHRTDQSPPQPSSPSTGCHLSLQRLRLSNLKTRRDPFRR